MQGLILTNLYPLSPIGGHAESGNPQIEFIIEDRALTITVFGPKGQRRLYCQVADQDVLALSKWLELACQEIYRG